MQIDLQSDEWKIDTWSVLYQSPGGKRYNGKLTVTNKRLLCDLPFDLEVKTAVPEVMFIKWVASGFLEIKKADIERVIKRRQVFERRMEIILKDNSKHVFIHGLLSSGRLMKAINKDMGIQQTTIQSST